MISDFINKAKLCPVVLALFLIACEGNPPAIDPLKGPEIEIIEVIPEVQTLEICGLDDPNSIALSSYDSLKLTLGIKAVNGLSQYKIDIHGNFDCHSHGRTLDSNPWQVLKVEEMSGDDVIITEILPVPEDVQAGDYHFMLQALDLLGNEAEWVLYSLKISNQSDTQSPEIHITNLSTDELSVKKGESINLELAIADNEDLHGGRIDVFYYNSQGSEFTADQYYFPEHAGIAADYSFSFTPPASLSSGVYDYLFRVYDAVGNVSEEWLKVTIEG